MPPSAREVAPQRRRERASPKSQTPRADASIRPYK